MKRLVLVLALSAAPALQAQDSSAYYRSAGPPPKDETTAFALSFLVPGLGQLYSVAPVAGAVQLGAAAGGIALAVHNGQQVEHCTSITGYVSEVCTSDTRNKSLVAVGLLAFGASWVYSMLDAPSAARRFNERHRVAAIVQPAPGAMTRLGLALSF